MKTLLLLLNLFCIPLLCFAQPTPPDTLWTHAYPEFVHAWALSVVPAFDGGLVMTGWQEFEPADTFAVIPEALIVIHTDGTGNLEWAYQMGGGTATDTLWKGISVCRTADSAYLVLGQRHYADTLCDISLTKLDPDGNVIWQRSYHYFYWEYGWTLTPLLDGTYVVGANVWVRHEFHPMPANNIFLMDVNADGDTLWTRQWEGPQWERLVHYVLATSDSGCLVTGADCPEGPFFCDQVVIKLAAGGRDEWERVDPVASAYGRVCAVEVSDGYVFGTNYYRITRLEKMSLAGETQWLQPYEVETERIEQPIAVMAANDGGYLIACQAQIAPLYKRAPVLIKTDAQGNMQWRMVGELPESHIVEGFCATPEGNLVFTGNSNVPRSYDPGYMWAEEFGWESAAEEEAAAMLETISLYPNFPNPFNPVTEVAFDLPRTTAVTVTVYDMLGQQVALLASGVQTAGHHVVTFDGSALPSGMYFCRLQTADVTQSRKMVLLK